MWGASLHSSFDFALNVTGRMISPGKTLRRVRKLKKGPGAFAEKRCKEKGESTGLISPGSHGKLRPHLSGNIR